MATITEQRILYAPERLGRLLPQTNEASVSSEVASLCPLCPGNEVLTPSEIWTYNPEGWFNRSPDIPGWEVRIVPNKYRLPGTLDSEVVVFAPDHESRISGLSIVQLRKVFFGIRERFSAHEEEGKASIFFVNEGKPAGSSLDHPHGQLVALSLEEWEPDWVEKPSPEQVVVEDENLILYCPDRSEFTLEMALRPKELEGSFSAFSYEKLEALAESFRTACLSLENIPLAQTLAGKSWGTQRVPYNVYLKECILNGQRGWYFRFCPRLTIPAGYELSTGRVVNIVPPVKAAGLLRETALSLPSNLKDSPL